ncbi:hypothetical protein [Diaphorobacter caeni]|nr:hypothetical protein [Diaphorobacter caeni]MBF5007615.1 hypothetical protein [Diaphorobacter caeni]
MKVSKDTKVAKCREALQEAMDWGHAETEIRRLAKLDAWAVEPAKKKS